MKNCGTREKKQIESDDEDFLEDSLDKFIVPDDESLSEGSDVDNVFYCKLIICWTNKVLGEVQILKQKIMILKDLRASNIPLPFSQTLMSHLMNS
ncbi:hypothetical protein EB796_002828 [Bugula neritina]|uniref:Uncharacterized protein n=1 Tax=Bugula neritina TaxID=10212 RepID=A0A7J7KLC8_BUGNE|nr:hypothetical protein EB796_002828 [Bugula neritina]